MPARRMENFIAPLEKAKIPKSEVSIIIRNLERVEKAGASQDQLGTVVNNIINLKGFKEKFLKDYKAAGTVIRNIKF
jgi:hypothetical protein